MKHLKISSGKLKGRKLLAPDRVKSTMEQVKLALMNSLSNIIPDSTFLDLFAGSGAVGFEALSRGARFVVFVEKDRKTAGFIRKNAVNLGVSEQVKIINADWKKAIKKLSDDRRKFDIVFADPFYESTSPDEILKLIIEGKIISETGIIVIETSIHTPYQSNPDRQIKFGDTLLLFFEPKH